MTATETAPAADMVLVRNVSGRMLTLNLVGKHLAAAAPRSPHRYKNVKLVTVHHAKNGALVARVRKTLMADSIRFPAGIEMPVAKCAMFCPEVKKAIAAKKLRVVADPYVPPPAKPEEKKPAAKSDH
jgi:hypothetical protein